MDPDAVVPNQAPQCDVGSVRLAVCGESPGVEEQSWRHCIPQGHGYGGEHWQNRQLTTRDRCPLCGSQQWAECPTPFVGESGRLLDSLLRDAGLPRERVFCGNVSRHPLSEGEKTLEQNRGGLARLAYDLAQFKPNVVLCLGNLSLSAFLGEGHAVSNWRGSIVQGTLEGVTYKVVVAVHPAAILREPSQLCLLRHDVARAVAEAGSSMLATPQRVVDAPTNAEEVCAHLRMIRERQQPVGFDIEGGVQTGVTVCSFATSPTHALSVPFKRMNWTSVWSKDDELGIQMDVRAVLEDANVPKVMHNASFEMFAMRWLYGVIIRNVEDSMLAFHVCLPELDKALDVVASLYTRQPYWGTTKDWTCDADRDLYNVIDSCVCLEAWQAIMGEMSEAQRAYYEHQRALLEPCLEMSFDGMPYDSEKRDAMVAALEREVHTLSGELDSLAGIPLPSFSDIAQTVCFKNKLARVKTWDDCLLYAKPSQRESP
jgi:uracil-DNA glycosylase family 4